MQSYFRIHPAGEDPEKHLDPEQQVSEPWGGSVKGRCDKCGGSGTTLHECQSCKAGGPDPDCPACGGELSYSGECPSCSGSGEIDESSRDGVSVFPVLEGLYRYIAKRDADLDGCVVVELEGTRSADEDFDADEGALLVHPQRIIATRPLDHGRVEGLRRNLAG